MFNPEYRYYTHISQKPEILDTRPITKFGDDMYW